MPQVDTVAAVWVLARLPTLCALSWVGQGMLDGLVTATKEGEASQAKKKRPRPRTRTFNGRVG